MSCGLEGDLVQIDSGKSTCSATAGGFSRPKPNNAAKIVGGMGLSPIFSITVLNPLLEFAGMRFGFFNC